LRCVTAIEMSSASRRTKITTYQFVSFTFGVCMLAMIAWATGGEWKLFVVLTSVPCAAFLLAFRSVPTAPKYNVIHKKIVYCNSNSGV
jgi:hypothetical protein